MGKDSLDEIQQGFHKWVDWNAHDMGEMGRFIRVKYVNNYIKDQLPVAINKTIMEDMLAIIGEDENDQTEPGEKINKREYLIFLMNRNQLRAELRQAIIKKYGGTR